MEKYQKGITNHKKGEKLLFDHILSEMLTSYSLSTTKASDDKHEKTF